MPAKKIAILGGGIAGLTAAHELSDPSRAAHFDITIYEASSRVGGKAKSVDVDRGGPGNHVPGEHGFRFFPRYYRHVIDTMERIPSADGSGHVADCLVPTRERMIARYCNEPIILPTGLQGGGGVLQDLLQILDAVADASDLNVPSAARRVFARSMFKIMTSCRERRQTEIETMSWMDFVEGEDHGPDYEVYLARGLSRTLVAARADLINAKTGGDVLLQFFLDVLDPGSASDTDRILNGPTSKTWLDPWRGQLDDRGVDIRENAEVQSIAVQNGRIASVDIRNPSTGATETIDDADFYIAALPVERMAALVSDDLIAADPVFQGVRDVLPDHLGWMLGLQYYLNRDLQAAGRKPLADGHATHIDSHWALTSILQSHFWDPASHGNMPAYANGMVKGILSVIVSNWNLGPVGGDPASCAHHGERLCLARDTHVDEIKRLVWQQLKWSLNVSDGDRLSDTDIELPSYLTDSLIVDARGFPVDNAQQLFLNNVNAQPHRPSVTTDLPNFLLAADYVRCEADLATMEAANETGRRAVNAIISTLPFSLSECETWEVFDDDIQGPTALVTLIKAARHLDKVLFTFGRGWDPDVFDRIFR